MVKELDDAGIEYVEYNEGRQINAKDLEGTIHTFYPTTGTIVLHASNSRYDNRTYVIRNKTITQFIKGLKVENLTSHYFKGGK